MFIPHVARAVRGLERLGHSHKKVRLVERRTSFTYRIIPDPAYERKDRRGRKWSDVTQAMNLVLGTINELKIKAEFQDLQVMVVDPSLKSSFIISDHVQDLRYLHHWKHFPAFLHKKRRSFIKVMAPSSSSIEVFNKYLSLCPQYLSWKRVFASCLNTYTL